MGKISDFLSNLSLNSIPYTTAIILAAGSSARMGPLGNKLFKKIDGVPVLAHTLLAYQKCPEIKEIIVVTKKDFFADVMAIEKDFNISKLSKVIEGGLTRQSSAFFGMRAINGKTKFVCFADGARCLTTPAQISSVCYTAYKFKAAGAAHAVSDSMKRTNKAHDVIESVERENLWQMQTPQVFHTVVYLAALKRAKEDRFVATDDSALIEHLGYRTRLVECGPENIKITTPDDLKLAAALMEMRK